MSEIIIIDPRKIPLIKLPIVVFVADRSGSFLSSMIKSAYNYNHVMELYKPGYFASQDMCGFRKVKIEKYLTGRYFLKFVSIKDMTPEERLKWILDIEKDLAKPWHKKLYDFLGIFGHLLHRITRIKWLRRIVNFPGLAYCVEKVRNRLSYVFNLLLPLEPEPGEFDKALDDLECCETIGFWFKE